MAKLHLLNINVCTKPNPTQQQQNEEALLNAYCSAGGIHEY
jgi:hypothetical protein